MEVQTDKTDSVEISINAKGLMSGKVKCYAKTSEEAMKLATTRAAELKAMIGENNVSK
jgi:hypothetical protein